MHARKWNKIGTGSPKKAIVFSSRGRLSAISLHIRFVLTIILFHTAGKYSFNCIENSFCSPYAAFKEALRAVETSCGNYLNILKASPFYYYCCSIRFFFFSCDLRFVFVSVFLKHFYHYHKIVASICYYFSVPLEFDSRYISII